MMLKKIAAWYRGRPEGNGQVVHIRAYRQHWTAQWSHRVVEVVLRYWVWFVLIALIGLIYGFQRLF